MVVERPPYNVLITTFTKGLEYDGWEGELRLKRSLPGGGQIMFHENVLAHLHRVPNFRRQWKIDQRLDFLFEQPVNDRFKWLLSGEQERFRDQRAYRYEDDVNPVYVQPDNPQLLLIPAVGTVHDAGDISCQYMAIGAGYKNTQKFSAWGSLGPLFEDRRGEENRGARLDMDIQCQWSDAVLQADGWLNRLNVGNDYSWTAAMNGEHSFTQEADDQYNVSFSSTSQREFSASEIGAEGQRYDERLDISNRLTGGKISSMQVTWKSDLSRQRTAHSELTREYTDHQFTWENDISAVHEYEGFRTALTAGLDLQEQQYADALVQGQRNYLGIYTMLAGSFVDSSAIEARVINYRFDTPDENDLNDRDELRYHIVFRTGKKLLPGLGLRVKLEADLHHLVYIFRPRSAENRWSRLFRLSCELPWQDGNVTNISRFSVVGNYNVYDYPPAENELSRAYRFFNAEDTLQFKIHPRWDLTLGAALLLDEHGCFRWDEWVEDISENGYNLSTSLMAHYKTDGVLIGFGWKLNQRYSWLHVSGGEKVRGDAVRSDGPSIQLQVDPAERLHVEFSGHVLRVDDRHRRAYNLPDIRCSLTWLL